VGASSGGGDLQIQSSALIVIDSTITRNVTGSKTSGIGTRGGGIHNDLGAVVVKGSTISDNSVLALAGGLGGGIENAMGVVAVFDTVLSGNTIETKNLFAGGGAVFNLCGVLWVDNADLMGNEAGAMYLSNGGAIFNMVGSSATVSRSTIADNRSGNGGGIANLYRSALTIENSTIRDNSESGIIGADGGGIKNAEGSTTSITRCTVSGNRAEGRARGGGIFNLANFKTGPLGGILYRESSVGIENSTISHNTVEGEEFWIITLGAFGGGIYNGVEDPFAIASVSIQSSTIANNGASGYPMDCGTLAPWCMGGTVGGGLYNTDAPGFPNTGSFGPALMSIRNSLVIGNYPTNCDQHSETSSATFRGADNLESDGKCFAYSWKIAGPSLSSRFATPSSPVLLGPLDNNGGPTFTHALLNGSPGVDKGVNCPETDQRGIVRPDGQCDIGAFERSRPVGIADDYELFEGQPLTVGAEEGVKSNDLAMPDSTVIVQNPPMNGPLTLDPDGSFVYTPFSEYSGPDHFTYIVEDKEHLASDPATVFLTVIPLLEVVSVFPGAGAVDVAADANIIITFDTPIAASSMDGHIFISSPLRGHIGFTYIMAGNLLTLDPSEDFRPGEHVTVVLNEGLRGTDGSAPLGPEVFQFVATAPHGDGQFIQTDMLGDDRSRHVALGDLNGDGVLDAFIATMVGNSRVWLGVGNGEFTESSHRPPTLGITGVALGDLDGDGDLDAFLANGFTSCMGRFFDVSENTVWLNNGYGRFRDSGQRLGNGVGERVALGDVDGDGDLDAFVANSGIYTGYVSNNDQRARDRLWLNDGGGHFSRSSQDLGAWHSAAVDLGDLDGDGDLDAVVAVERDWYRDDGEWHSRPSDRVWLNDGTGRFSGSGQLLDSRRSTDVSLADLDGDGDIDAFILDISGNKLWLNNGSGVFVEGQENRTWDVYASDAALGDLDGDGDIDALVANDAVLFLGYTDPHGESVWLNQNTPLVQDDIYSGQEDQPLVVTVPGLLANDMDPDGDPIATSLTRFPQHRTLETFNPDGSFTYAPNPDFNGTDTFAYRIADAHQESTQATVTLQISAVNNAPKAIDGFYDLVPGSPLSVSAPSGILDNGSDIDGDPLNVFLDQGPKRGTLTLNPDGSFTYTPDPETVADAFTCHIRDGFLNSDIIRIKLGNTVPVATGDLLYTFTPGTPLVVGPSFGLLAGVSDTDGDPLTVRIAQDPRGGDLALNPDGAFTYTPYPGTVTDAFNYHVTDGMAETGIIRVKIGNTAPVAIDDPGYQTREETPLVITADAGLLANDQDLDGDVFLAMEDQPPQNGMLQLGPDGSFTYTPNDGFFGTDFFPTTSATNGRNRLLPL